MDFQQFFETYKQYSNRYELMYILWNHYKDEPELFTDDYLRIMFKAHEILHQKLSTINLQRKYKELFNMLNFQEVSNDELSEDELIKKVINEKSIFVKDDEIFTNCSKHGATCYKLSEL